MKKTVTLKVEVETPIATMDVFELVEREIRRGIADYDHIQIVSIKDLSDFESGFE